MVAADAKRAVNVEPDVIASAAEARALSAPPLLVLDALERFLDGAGLGHGAVEAVRIGEGVSNVTFVVTRAGFEGVLRRPPRPPFPARAHDVLREVRLLTALRRSSARVPRVLAACEDSSVLGVPFYLMERIEGRVLAYTLPDEFRAADARRRIAEEFVDALAELHRVDVEAPQLTEFVRPESYSLRQLRVYSRIWDEQLHRPNRTADAVRDLLWARVPSPTERSVVHGDYRLGNVMFGPEAPPRLVAVLDWEVASIGDPAYDLGYLLATYPEPSDDSGYLLDFAAFAALPGFPTRAELIDRYEHAVGRSVGDLRWHVALANWRTAVGLESFYQRGHDAERLELGVPDLFERAQAALERAWTSS